jgi:hypothetical protein
MLNKSLEKIYVEGTFDSSNLFCLQSLLDQLEKQGIPYKDVTIEADEEDAGYYDGSTYSYVVAKYKRLETDKEYSERMKEIKAEEALLKRQKERDKEQKTKQEADRKKLYEKLKKEFEGGK